MAFPRTTVRFLATAALAAVAATPAFGAEASTQPAEALRLVSPASPASMAVREARLALERNERAAARKARRNEGPFLPITGKVDFGTSANGFGAARSGHVHAGHDLFAPSGTPLVAVTDGVIAETGSDAGQGNYLYLYDPQADRTFVYMHMVEPSRHEAGAKVEAGELLGGVGCTGSCFGEHLHFEIRDGKGYAGEAHDPMPELKRWESIPKPL